MDWKRFGKKLLFPPVWLLILLTAVSGAGLGAVFVRDMSETAIAYGLYALSFYTLCALTLFCVAVLPKRLRAIKERVYANPLGNRFMTDRVFRTKVTLNASLGVNLLYVGTNVLMWYLQRSWWFVVLACYYAVLSLMRFLLVRYVHRNAIGSSLLGEWKRSRICAVILLLVNLSLSGAVLMILYQNRGFDYPGVLIYVVALYTFYSTIHAVTDLIKYRRLGSPVLSTAKIVSLSSALVSMLSLETAMFSQFGAEMAKSDQQLMIILTGAGVSAVVIALSVLLIVRAGREIRSMQNGTKR